MGKNRKIPKKMSVVANTTLRIGAVIVVFFVMVILNVLSSSSCSQLVNEKGEKERLLRKLDAALARETSRWDAMKTPDRVEAALIRHGLAMKLPRADQNVYMNRDGQPRHGQLSVARAKQRAAGARIVQVQPVVRKGRR